MGTTSVRCEKFLRGDLEDQVYMEIPPNFKTHGGKNKVCLLKEGLIWP